MMLCTNAVPRPKYILTRTTHSAKDTRFLQGKILEIYFLKSRSPLDYEGAWLCAF